MARAPLPAFVDASAELQARTGNLIRDAAAGVQALAAAKGGDAGRILAALAGTITEGTARVVAVAVQAAEPDSCASYAASSPLGALAMLAQERDDFMRSVRRLQRQSADDVAWDALETRRAEKIVTDVLPRLDRIAAADALVLADAS